MTWVNVLEFEVPGIPVPQGSKVAQKGKHQAFASVVDSNKATLKPWRATVTNAAYEAIAGSCKPEWSVLDEPLAVTLEFVFPRPQSHFRSGAKSHELKPSAPHHKTSKPDLDKLERAMLDGITDAGVWRDDSCVVELHGRKVYGPRPKVVVVVQALGTIPGQQALA